MPTTTDIHNHEMDQKEYIKSNIYEDLNKISEGISRTESLDIIVSNVLKQYKLNLNVKVFADKESISFIKESQIIFADGTVESLLIYFIYILSNTYFHFFVYSMNIIEMNIYFYYSLNRQKKGKRVPDTSRNKRRKKF